LAVAVLTKAAEGRALQPAPSCKSASDSDRPQTTTDLCGRIAMTTQGYMGYGITVARLVELLNLQPQVTQIDKPIVDQTQLTGTYNFELKFRMPVLPGLRTDQSLDLPDFTSALREQLGLRIESSRATLEVLVVDHVEPPAAN